MQPLAEVDLPFLPLEDPAFSRDPYSHIAAARKKHPWLAKSNFGYVVHEFTAIRELYGQDDKLRPAYDGIVAQLDAHGTPWGRYMEQQMISLPLEQHRLLRDTFAVKFTPRFANSLRPVMRANINRILDEWVPKGRFDFEEMASYFPISVMFALIGAPFERIADMRWSLETFGLALAMDKGAVPAINEAYVKTEKFVFDLIAERRANPKAGNAYEVLNLLIKTSDGGAISERQLVDMIIFFFVAGYDTSKNVLTFTMHQLMQLPEIYERCAVDIEYCAKVVEEGLRYYNPGTAPRFTSTDFTFRDVLLPKDTMMLFTFSTSGRDPGTFRDPDKFDPERHIDPAKRHAAFGLGRHMCLGQHIARTQLQEAIHQIAQRLPNPRLVGEYGWRPFPGTWGLKGLPITFARANPA
jgi:cytochrome P450